MMEDRCRIAMITNRETDPSNSIRWFAFMRRRRLRFFEQNHRNGETRVNQNDSGTKVSDGNEQVSTTSSEGWSHGHMFFDSSDVVHLEFAPQNLLLLCRKRCFQLRDPSHSPHDHWMITIAFIPRLFQSYFTSKSLDLIKILLRGRFHGQVLHSVMIFAYLSQFLLITLITCWWSYALIIFNAPTSLTHFFERCTTY